LTVLECRLNGTVASALWEMWTMFLLGLH